MADILAFRWFRYPDPKGYRWADAIDVLGSQEVEARVLTAKQSGFARQEVYEPLKLDIALFKVFAATEPTEDGIRSFAGNFGMLGGSLERQVLLADHPEKMLAAEEKGFGAGRVIAERLEDWQSEIALMNYAVRLWDAVKKRDEIVATELLEKFQTAVPASLIWPGPGEATRNFAFGHIDRYDRQALYSEHGATGARALSALKTIVNDKMKNEVFPALHYDTGDRPLRLAFEPRGLLGALWFQFASAIDGNRTYRSCEECGTPFEVKKVGHPKSRQYCSAACRVRAHRKRKGKNDD